MIASIKCLAAYLINQTPENMGDVQVFEEIAPLNRVPHLHHSVVFSPHSFTTLLKSATRRTNLLVPG